MTTFATKLAFVLGPNLATGPDRGKNRSPRCGHIFPLQSRKINFLKIARGTSEVKDLRGPEEWKAVLLNNATDIPDFIHTWGLVSAAIGQDNVVEVGQLDS